jgi:hypothetical protein
VETYVIPGDSTSITALTGLQARINKFISDFDGPNSLTIFVYSGHGALVERPNSKQYLIG